MSLVVRIAGRLATWAKATVPVTDDFVLFVHDEEGGPELAARTMPEALAARLFADDRARDAARDAARALPPAERARLLVSRFGKFDGLGSEVAQQELVAMGEGALDALLEVVGDAKIGWTAAMVLGKLGIPRPDVVDTLRANVGRHLWHAMALGLLGDHAWLAQQPAHVAVSGLTAPLLAWAGTRSAVDYQPLTALLDRGDTKLVRAVEAALAPGKSYGAITADAVPSALEGLSSRHAAIRWHAAAVLGHRPLGTALGARILPALAERLDDPSPLVRRLAVLSIGAWKADGAWLRPRLEAMRDDSNDVVRKIVAHVLT
jgi:HEAT repeat protein